MSLPVFIAAVCCLNLLGFCLMGADKSRARQGLRRIRERTLWLSALCFGAIGTTTGMYFFRHKTKHVSFAVGFPILFAIEIIALTFVARLLA